MNQPVSGAVALKSQKPLRVNFLAPKIGLSGGTRIFLGYAHHLASRGHDVRVYVKDRNTARRWVANTFGFGVPKWLGVFSAKIIRVPDFSERSIRDADVLFVTTAQVAIEAAGLPKTKGDRYYLVQHDEGLYHANKEIAARAYRLPFLRLAVSTWVKDQLLEHYGASSEVLLNPIDHELFHQVRVSRTDGEIRILMLEHPFDWKGSAEGFSISRRVQSRHRALRINGFGSRTTTPAERKYDAYVFDPKQHVLATLYSSADIFLCPSWDEGFGLPSLEAMACGALVVTYDNGGSRDFAIHERTALVAPRRDQAALERELERAVTDLSVRKALAEKGREFAGAFPSWEAQTAKLEAIIARTKS